LRRPKISESHLFKTQRGKKYSEKAKKERVDGRRGLETLRRGGENPRQVSEQSLEEGSIA